MWDEKLLLERGNSPVSEVSAEGETVAAARGVAPRAGLGSRSWAHAVERCGTLRNVVLGCRLQPGLHRPRVWPAAEQLSLQAEASESPAWGKRCFDRRKPVQEELINSFPCCGIVDAAL